MKKKLSVFLCFSLLLCTCLFSGCTGDEEIASAKLDTSKLLCDYNIEELRGTEINVYNWGEYVSDGAEGTVDVIAEFEAVSGIKVHYNTYASNEDLYAKLKSGGVSYDIVVPSDYMIERIQKEGLLQKLDFLNIPNAKFVPEDYKNLFFDEKNEYTVPYTGGMVGLIYNTTMVEGTPDSWSILWDPKYSEQILTFNNSRDAFGVAQYLLGYDVNSTDENEWRIATEKLKEQKLVLQSYVMDEVFNKMESGEAALAPYYAGDFLAMQDINPDLAFVYPKEGTNRFVDSFCIPKSAQNKAAAELFINFMCEPEVALQNAEYLGYLCPNTGVLEDERYSLKDSTVLYPEEPIKTQYFHNMDKKMLDLLTNLWEEVKLAKA